MPTKGPLVVLVKAAGFDDVSIIGLAMAPLMGFRDALTRKLDAVATASST